MSQLDGTPPQSPRNLTLPEADQYTPTPPTSVASKFIKVARKELQLPVCPMPPRVRRPRTPLTEDGLPRRSVRLAGKYKHRVSKPEIQAQNVLMNKWGLTSENHPPDADALKAYKELYEQPLSSAHRKAIRALFTAEVPQCMGVAQEIQP